MNSLGYGCSSLMGRISRKQSRVILDAAYDAGITHFDVARSYGYGDAEAVVGEFCRNKRSRISLVTKVGFAVAKMPWALRALRGIVSPLASITGPMRQILRKRAAAALISRPPLTPELIRSSLETSLRELQTDYVDALLLHEATAEELADEELLVVLQELVRQGKILRFGVGSGLDKIPEILATRREFVRVLQFENNPARRSMERFDLAGVERVITHRAVGPVLSRLQALLRERVDLARQFVAESGLKAADTEALAALLLGYSLNKNPNGLVLFSSLDKHHLVANIRAAEAAPRITPGQIASLERLAAELPVEERAAS